MSILNKPHLFDPVTNCPVSVSFAEYRTHGGWTHRTTVTKEILPTQEWLIFFIPPPPPYRIHMRPSVIITMESTVEYYENPVNPTGGNIIFAQNMNREYDRITLARGWEGVSVDSFGLKLESMRVLPNTNLLEDMMESHWVLNPLRTYLVRVVAHLRGHATLAVIWHEWNEQGEASPT